MSVIDYCRHDSKRRLLRGEDVPWIRNKGRRYCKMAVLSFPLWVKISDFNYLVAEKERLEKLTGIPHTFGHIVPLTHRRVCGLSVPWNMEVITQFKNYSQGNRWCGETVQIQLELF